MTIGEALRLAAARLRAAGCDAPMLEAQAMMARLADRSRAWLMAHGDAPLPEDIAGRWDAWVTRRAAREPLAYILGEKEFWSRPFAVTKDVLVPRPETEHLIEAVLEAFPDQDGAWNFCDIGTGSGCIAVTLACEYPEACVTATDVSDAALEVARRNARRHGVDGRVAFRQGDMLAALDASDGPFDAIVSNPPYVAADEMAALAPELAHEPVAALTDGADGLSFLRMLVDEAARWLRPGGALVVETGLCGLPGDGSGLRLEREIRDLAGRLRGGVYRRRESA